MGTLWLSWGFSPLQGDPQWSVGCCYPKNASFQKVPLFIELDDGKIYRKALYLMVKTMVSCRFSLKSIQWSMIWETSLLRLEYIESANLTQSDRNARQPTMTWSAAPAPAGISRRGMNASRSRFWATLDGLSVMYSCLKIFCVILCLRMFILSCRYWYILPTYVREYIYIYCIIYIVIILLLIIIKVIIIIISILCTLNCTITILYTHKLRMPNSDCWFYRCQKRLHNLFTLTLKSAGTLSASGLFSACRFGL